jgi:hypothetical protein
VETKERVGDEVGDRRPPTALLSQEELKDSKVSVALVEVVVAEQAVERVPVEDVALEEMLEHLASHAHSATDPVISGLTASVVSNSTKLQEHRRT